MSPVPGAAAAGPRPASPPPVRALGMALPVVAAAPVHQSKAEAAINREVAHDPFQMGQQHYASALDVTHTTRTHERDRHVLG